MRSFYYDLHAWAADEPERWAPWAASCPRINERSADRTRLCQPLLPLLVRHVEERNDHTRTLQEQASSAATNTPSIHDGRTYRRVLAEEDLTLARGGHRTPVRVRDDTGQLVRIEAEEETAFWDRAAVETLRARDRPAACPLRRVRSDPRAGGEVDILRRSSGGAGRPEPVRACPSRRKT